MEEKKAPQSDDQTNVEPTIGKIEQSQIGAIGSHAQGTVSGTININSSAVEQVDVEALKAALKDLFATLAQTNLPQDAQISAQVAAGTALNQGVKDNKIDPETLTTHVKQVGDTLKEANVVVQEGTSLWNSVRKVASVVGPIVGGAAQVLSWFGIL